MLGRTMTSKTRVLSLLAALLFALGGTWFLFSGEASASRAYLLGAVNLVQSDLGVLVGWWSGTPFSVKGATVTVRVADTPEEQSVGLGGIRRLSEDKGMLYVYPLASFYTHSMKGMLFPLDIIWISADKKIADVITNVAPSTYPEYQFVNDFFAQYVLEIPAGFFEKHKLKLGDQVAFELEEARTED